MSSRQTRRKLLKAFRHDVSARHGRHLVTYLLDNEDVPPNGVLRDAITFWQASRIERRPICICCKRSFVGGVETGSIGEVEAAGFLLARAPAWLALRSLRCGKMFCASVGRNRAALSAYPISPFTERFSRAIAR